MMSSAWRKLQLAGRILNVAVNGINRRGLAKEREEYGATKNRIIALRFTDDDIRDAEKKSLIPPKIYMFFLSSTGHVKQVTLPNIKPDVLLYLTISTLVRVSKAHMTLQEAYRLRLVQIRYMKDVDKQEEDFLHDAGLAVKFFNIIQAELSGADASSP